MTLDFAGRLNDIVGKHNVMMVQALGWIFAFEIPGRLYRNAEAT